MARSRWTKSGKPGKYGMEFDVSDDFYSSPDSEEWFKKFTNGAKTVGVNERGPAGGNPMFILTSDDLDTLEKAMQAYYTGKNGEDLFENIEGRNRKDGWEDSFNNYLFETSSKGPDYWKQFGEGFTVSDARMKRIAKMRSYWSRPNTTVSDARMKRVTKMKSYWSK